MDVTFNVELDHFEASLRELSMATKKPYQEIIRRAARLIAVNLAYQTQPLGDDARALAQGENAVIRDVRRVYTTIDVLYEDLKKVAARGRRNGEQIARAFYASVCKGDLERARKIVRGAGIQESWIALGRFDGGAAHQRRRNARGRVNGNNPSLAVIDPQQLKAYFKFVIRHVGQSKGGWAEGARILGGTSGIPSWVARHRGQGGADDLTDLLNDPHVVLRNNVPWLRSILTNRQMTEALRVQREKFERHIDYVLNHLARKHLAHAA